MNFYQFLVINLSISSDVVVNNGVPKIHKSDLLNNGIEIKNNEIIRYPEPLDLKVRPLVGRFKCPTHKRSNFIDMMHKFFVKHIPGYVKDGVDSLSKCTQKQNIRLLMKFLTS